MEAIFEPIMNTCFPCCSNFEDYTTEAMNMINKQLGNIKDSHSAITFLGLLNTKLGKSKVVHYLASESLYNDVEVPKKDEGDLDEA